MNDRSSPVIIVGGGIGGLSAALALSRNGFPVKVLEQAAELSELGAGVQLGPNAFSAYDALGVGEYLRTHAVVADQLIMMDAIDATEIARVPLGQEFRDRFGAPYAVAHRADLHRSLMDTAIAQGSIEIRPSTRIVQVDQDDHGVTARDAAGETYRGRALIACDGVRSVVREQFVGDEPRVSGHIVYRAVIDADDFPEDMRWNGPSLWVGPHCHLIHYPLSGGDKFNLVMTFRSSKEEVWGVTEGSKEELLSHFGEVHELPRALLELPKSWLRWATADRDPIEKWTFGRVTLLGDAAHPMMQYLAQGACMAVEDAVTLGAAFARHPSDVSAALSLYERSRIVRTARVVLSTRAFGDIVHVKGVERQVRKQLWHGRSPDRFYDALEWLYAWRPENCLDELN